MRFRKKNVQLVLIVIFLIVYTRFFYLIKLPEYFSGAASNVSIGGLASISVFFIFLCINGGNLILGKYSNSFFYLLIILIINTISMREYYGYKYSTIIWYLIPYLIILIYYPIILYINSEEKYQKFIKIIEIISIILNVILLIQVVVYNNKHILFLNITLNDWYTIYHPTASIRLYGVAEGLIRISVMLSFYELFKNKFSLKKNIIHYSNALLCILAIIFVDQSRIYLLVVMASIFVMYLFEERGKIKKKNIVGSMIVIFFFMLLVMFKLPSVLETLNDSSSGSSYARSDAILYYLNNIKGSKLFTGLGVVIPTEGSMAFYKIKGPLGIYNYDDIGILGIFASTGLLGFIWYICIIIQNFLISKRAQVHKALSVGLATLMFLSMFTLDYLDANRIIALAMTLAIIDVNSKGYEVRNID